MDATKKLVDDILADRVNVTQLDFLQLEAVIKFLRGSIDELIQTSENEEELAYLEGLSTLVDLMEDAADRKFDEQDTGDWGVCIKVSISRGNTYFELEEYTLH